ncbi:DUF4180 domain-containing protein [Arthrobacter sp. I2-34]|uniref:DUF4180 domain-containing protein n=1 Tax=Arthrobacter hankyongi TaxID=2904801 RepID=A0ABS9L7B1_9MICC|nr:DUF4180 domain-containing protein [Arthrobacter hankyongi]MCG2622468.1 DUF4180 domain-containing protein [Arthrobacter hankyongi]
MRREDNDGIRVLFVEPDGPVISTSEQSSDLIGNAWVQGVEVLALPVARLDPEFFRLRSRFAGELTQKIVNYQVKLAVIGDVGEWTGQSGAFRDFVAEANRGGHIWFLPDAAALAAKLAPRSLQPVRSEG